MQRPYPPLSPSSTRLRLTSIFDQLSYDHHRASSRLPNQFFSELPFNLLRRNFSFQRRTSIIATRSASLLRNFDELRRNFSFQRRTSIISTRSASLLRNFDERRRLTLCRLRIEAYRLLLRTTATLPS